MTRIAYETRTERAHPGRSNSACWRRHEQLPGLIGSRCATAWKAALHRSKSRVLTERGLPGRSSLAQADSLGTLLPLLSGNTLRPGWARSDHNA